ncbi:MAG: J domain-containing protein [Candidatus Dormibacteraeota bacterium]|nr:J domain-containing protein [Candidatus Dormibacteraeota bacterium]MBV9524328.1 J domain-containing protein [Candidatus Dormibacteraeota bacterium]
MPTTFKDYYATLGVPRTATEKEIHSAFRKLARKYHPDINHEAGAEDRFKEVNEAHEVLGDAEKRRKYDELGPRWQEYEAWERAGRPGQNPFQQQPGGFEYRTVSPEELEDLFGDRAPFSDFFETFFGGGGSASAFSGRQPRRRTRTVASRGEDVEGEADITLEEAFQGTTRTVELETGGRRRRVEVRIPAGIHDGARVRAAGQGVQGSGGGASGDLFVRVRIQPHASFKREGANLTTRVHVPLAVAVAGGSVPVPTLRGTSVQLTVPPGTQNGARLRLRGLGMPHVKSEGTGDLVATIDVRLPHPLPDELKHWAAGQTRG